MLPWPALESPFNLICSCSACVAQGVEYTQSIATGWKPPARIRRLSEDDHQAVRDKFHIITEGDLLVPPVTTFQDLKLPPAMLRQLASKGIKKPTPIQMQVCGGSFLSWCLCCKIPVA